MGAKSIRATAVEYDGDVDILFAAFGEHDPSLIDHEESLGNGVYVQYSWPENELAFMEVWEFSKRYGSLPLTVEIGGGVSAVIPDAHVFA